MKVTLNIENDAELRSYIKDLVKGQVMSIVRDEFTEMVKEELERKLKGTDKYRFESMLKEAMKDSIQSIMYKEHNVSRWRIEYIKPYVEESIKSLVKDTNWDKLVDEAAKKLVAGLLK
jgi:hypothetical protein